MCPSWMPRCQQISRHLPFMSIKSFVQAQHRGRWQEMVSFNWRVQWPRPARVPLLSLRLNILWVPCGHSGRLLTHYHPREVRNSIYTYRKIHIDYQSKVSYRFISIIYGDTTNCKYMFMFPQRNLIHYACYLNVEVGVILAPIILIIEVAMRKLRRKEQQQVRFYFVFHFQILTLYMLNFLRGNINTYLHFTVKYRYNAVFGVQEIDRVIAVTAL